MKSLLLSSLLLLSATAFAENHDEIEKMDFPTAKQKILDSIEKRIADMNEHKACVSAATDKEGLKKCHQAIQEKRKAMREEWKAKKKEHKEKKKGKKM